MTQSPAPQLPSTLTIHLDASFPEYAQAERSQLAADVLDIVQSLFAGSPPAGLRPIVCTLNLAPVPVILVEPEARHAHGIDVPWEGIGQYHIGLTAPDAYYAQFAFQLAHELGHLMLEPRSSNFALETIAFATSRQVLDDLAARWDAPHNPPYRRQYATSFIDYLREDHDMRMGQIRKDIQDAVTAHQWSAVTAFLRSQHSYVAAHPTCEGHYTLNHLGAVMLAVLGIPWQDLIGLGAYTIPAPSRERRSNINTQPDFSRIPPSLLPLFAHLGYDW